MRHLIIGLGSIGLRHAKIILGKGHQVFGFDPAVKNDPGFYCFDILDPAWDLNPDVVWICTPTCLHAEYTIEALRRGCHVFVEKPIADSLKAAKKIHDTWLSIKEKRLIWTGRNMRYHPGVTEIKKTIEAGIIGNPLIFRIHFSHYLPNMRPQYDYRKTYSAHADQGGGVILDDIHDIDLALWFAGPVKKTIGMAVRSKTLDMDAEDVAHICLLHTNGCFSEIHMDFLRRDKSRGIEVIGENGTLEWRSSGKNPELALINLFSSGRQDAQQIWNKRIETFDEMFEKQFDDFIEAIKNSGQYDVSVKDAINALEVAVGIRKNIYFSD